MRFSEARGRKVVNTATAATLGKIDDAVIDTPSARVVALTLTKTSGPGDTITWPGVASFGGDAVTVDNDSAVVVPDESIKALSDKRHSLSGKRVLTLQGVELGQVKDFEFDPRTGAVRALLLKQGVEVPGENLIATGAYAVIVRPEQVH